MGILKLMAKPKFWRRKMRVSLNINKASLELVIIKMLPGQIIMLPFNLLMIAIGIFISSVKTRGAGVKLKQRQTN